MKIEIDPLIELLKRMKSKRITEDQLLMFLENPSSGDVNSFGWSEKLVSLIPKGSMSALNGLNHRQVLAFKLEGNVLSYALSYDDAMVIVVDKKETFVDDVSPDEFHHFDIVDGKAVYCEYHSRVVWGEREIKVPDWRKEEVHDAGVADGKLFYVRGMNKKKEESIFFGDAEWLVTGKVDDLSFVDGKPLYVLKTGPYDGPVKDEVMWGEDRQKTSSLHRRIMRPRLVDGKLAYMTSDDAKEFLVFDGRAYKRAREVRFCGVAAGKPIFILSDERPGPSMLSGMIREERLVWGEDESKVYQRVRCPQFVNGKLCFLARDKVEDESDRFASPADSWFLVCDGKRVGKCYDHAFSLVADGDGVAFGARNGRKCFRVSGRIS